MSDTETASDLIQFRHLTIPAPAALPLQDSASAIFDDLATRVKANGIAPMQEKIYGPCAQKEAVLAARRAAYARHGIDPSLPCTYTAGRCDADLGLAGVQMWGVQVREDTPVQVRTVSTRVGVVGRLLETPDVRMLQLAGVHGNPGGADGAPGVAEQARLMFENAGAALGEYGFAFDKVARTWVYLTRLLDWYGEFNRVRAAFFREHGIFDDGGFPASTGIQGTDGTGECLMDVLAVDGAAVDVRTIKGSTRQRRPMSYGSSFSRGVRVRCGRDDTIFVSGTASIDGAGQTLHCWQRESQIVETLLSIAALLEDHGTSLRDIRLATLFCKDAETLATFERVIRQLGMADLPLIPVLADVCRPELMVEIEAVAIVPPASAQEAHQ